MNIPLSRPCPGSNARKYIDECIQKEKLSGDGFFCKKSETEIKRVWKIKHALAVSSCTHALEMAISLLGAKPGDQVILPSFTFSSTANAVIRAGLTPIFADIVLPSMNLDIRDVEKKITPNTVAIMPVHYAGVACDLPALRKIAGKQIKIIEDAAHCAGGIWGNTVTGTGSFAGALSFHDSKNICAGEGGALLLDDDQMAEMAEIWREKGTNRAQFFRGQVDKYTWVDSGSSFILAEPLAAILLSSLEEREANQSARRKIYELYISTLKSTEKYGVILPELPKDQIPSWHLFHFLLKDENQRNTLMAHLRSHGIGATFHYIPLHTSPYGIRLGNRAGTLPVTEDAAYRLLRLPLYPQLADTEQSYIIDKVIEFFSG